MTRVASISQEAVDSRYCEAGKPPALVMAASAVPFRNADFSFVEAVVRPALLLAPATYLDDIRTGLRAEGVQDAVARQDTGPIFDWLMRLVQLQGISDAVAYGYADRHGHARYAGLKAVVAAGPSCPRLRSYWHFAECRYRKGTHTCSEPRHLHGCPLPTLPLRKGALNQAAFSLLLFVRDVCDGDLVAWLDRRLAQADAGGEVVHRSARMRAAVLGPLRGIHGVSDKVLSMALADLLLGGAPERERWVTAGRA